jgi:hypothetical protein
MERFGLEISDCQRNLLRSQLRGDLTADLSED